MEKTKLNIGSGVRPLNKSGNRQVRQRVKS